MTHRHWPPVAAALVLGGSLLGHLPAWAEPTAVSTILIDPSTFHRRAVMLRGTVKQVVRYGGLDYLNRPMCSQDFTLEDPTGEIPVRYEVRCKSGADVALLLHDGERVTIDATIEAPPMNVTTSKGSALGFKALARSIVRESH